jgi:hypothetical protein
MVAPRGRRRAVRQRRGGAQNVHRGRFNDRGEPSRKHAAHCQCLRTERGRQCKGRIARRARRAFRRSPQGIVLEFVAGDLKQSPSVQIRVDPTGRLDPISTHDQVLGGRSGQIFLGCRFPADEEYRLDIQASGMKAARVLADKGVLGRFGIDFISVKQKDVWRHLAIEINLRKGGTTHPFLMLQFLTDGRYDPDTGQFVTSTGRPRCYYASDNLESERYRGL